VEEEGLGFELASIVVGTSAKGCEDGLTQVLGFSDAMGEVEGGRG